MENIPVPLNLKSYISSLKNYYELKSTYEKRYERKKKKILSKSDSNNASIDPFVLSKIQKIKRKCIQCGKDGGTIFKQENRILTAVCNCSDPCDLNIKIKKSETVFLPEQINIHETFLNELKKQIITTKLNYIFDLEKEDITSQKFDVTREEYRDYDKIFCLLKKKLYDQHYKYPVEVEVVQEKGQKNPESKLLTNTEFVLKTDLITEKTKTLNKHIKNIKSIIQEHQTNSFENAVRIYLTNIIPLLEDIRKIKYDVLYLETVDVENTTKFYINQIKNYIDKYCYENEEGSVIIDALKKQEKSKEPTTLNELDDLKEFEPTDD